jgi:hypothetical protein
MPLTTMGRPSSPLNQKEIAARSTKSDVGPAQTPIKQTFASFSSPRGLICRDTGPAHQVVTGSGKKRLGGKNLLFPAQAASNPGKPTAPPRGKARDYLGRREEPSAAAGNGVVVGRRLLLRRRTLRLGLLPALLVVAAHCRRPRCPRRRARPGQPRKFRASALPRVRSPFHLLERIDGWSRCSQGVVTGTRKRKSPGAASSAPKPQKVSIYSSRPFHTRSPNSINSILPFVEKIRFAYII